jgi:hypothetical protein
MTKSAYIDEIIGNINTLEFEKVVEISNYIKYLKYQDLIDPTLELISNPVWIQKINNGIDELNEGKVLDWDSVK